VSCTAVGSVSPMSIAGSTGMVLSLVSAMSVRGAGLAGMMFSGISDKRCGVYEPENDTAVRINLDRIQS